MARTEIRRVPPSTLVADPNSWYGRSLVDLEEVKRLARRIRRMGRVEQPIPVRRDGDSYIIVAEWRWWLAAIRADLDLVPIIEVTGAPWELTQRALTDALATEPPKNLVLGWWLVRFQQELAADQRPDNFASVVEHTGAHEGTVSEWLKNGKFYPEIAVENLITELKSEGYVLTKSRVAEIPRRVFRSLNRLDEERRTELFQLAVRALAQGENPAAAIAAELDSTRGPVEDVSRRSYAVHRQSGGRMRLDVHRSPSTWTPEDARAFLDEFAPVVAQVRQVLNPAGVRAANSGGVKSESWWRAAMLWIRNKIRVRGVAANSPG